MRLVTMETPCLRTPRVVMQACVARQVADVHDARDGAHVVLAAGLEGDVSQGDEPVVAADVLEGAAQERGRVGLVALEPLAVGAGDAPGRVAQTLALRILARPADQGA